MIGDAHPSDQCNGEGHEKLVRELLASYSVLGSMIGRHKGYLNEILSWYDRPDHIMAGGAPMRASMAEMARLHDALQTAAPASIMATVPTRGTPAIESTSSHVQRVKACDNYSVAIDKRNLTVAVSINVDDNRVETIDNSGDGVKYSFREYGSRTLHVDPSVWLTISCGRSATTKPYPYTYAEVLHRAMLPSRDCVDNTVLERRNGVLTLTMSYDTGMVRTRVYVDKDGKPCKPASVVLAQTSGRGLKGQPTRTIQLVDGLWICARMVHVLPA